MVEPLIMDCAACCSREVMSADEFEVDVVVMRVLRLAKQDAVCSWLVNA